MKAKIRCKGCGENFKDYTSSYSKNSHCAWHGVGIFFRALKTQMK